MRARIPVQTPHVPMVDPVLPSITPPFPAPVLQVTMAQSVKASTHVSAILASKVGLALISSMEGTYANVDLTTKENNVNTMCLVISMGRSAIMMDSVRGI